MKYTWIEGYRDQGAEASHSLRSRVWQYVAELGMQVRKNADVAPATITVIVRPTASSTASWKIDLRVVAGRSDFRISGRIVRSFAISMSRAITT